MILCFSGGIDSYVAWHYLNKPQTVYFNFGTPYTEKELVTVMQLIPSTIVDNSLELGDRQVGDKAYIPYRNMWIAMLASKYDKEIVIAGLKDDMVSDKNPQAFQQMACTLNFIDNTQQVKIVSPFWEATKADVVRWFIHNVEDGEHLIRKTVSCYDRFKNYCGKCPSCFRKWNALYENDVPLNFNNRVLMLEYLKNAKDRLYTDDRNDSIIRCVTRYLNNNEI